MTLDELDHILPNGFHHAQLFSIELNYAAGSAKLDFEESFIRSSLFVTSHETL